MTSMVFAQSENYKSAIADFQMHYNAEKFDEIFNDFSPEMQQALPLEKAFEFFKGLKNRAGKIESYQFIDNQQETYATFKTTFEKMVLAVNFSLDNENRISGLFIKPYEEPKAASRNTINALQEYPEEISELIYAKTKDLPNNTQLSIAIIKNGKTAHYGVLKVNDTLKSITNHTKVFEIGSITKVFTATVLASLVTDKKINLTDTINAYYPFPFKDSITLRFKELANHTSGLPRLPENLEMSNAVNPYQNYGKTQLEAYLKNSLKISRTNRYVYSNLGAGLLGHTLGLTQHIGFRELLQKHVLDKYTMKNTFVNYQNLDDKLVQGQNPNGEPTVNWDWDVLFGAGGILSTTADLAKFAEAHFNPKDKTLALTRTPTFDINKNMKMGLGWHLVNYANGNDWIWHNGGTGGYASSITVNPTDKNAVIILSNLSAFHPKMGVVDGLCIELMQAIEKP